MSAFFEIGRELDNRIHISRNYNNFCEPHFHSNIELVYVIDGHFNININGHSKTLYKGCISISNSYDIHSYQTPESSDVILMIIPVEFVNSYNALFRTKALSKPFLMPSEHTEKVYHMLIQLLYSDASNELISKGIAYYVLGIITGSIELIDKPIVGNLDLARKILVFLQQNYLNKLTIESLSRHLGYNKDYLSRFFNSYFGIGFKSYMNALRSRHAANLLSNGNCDLTEIAFISGFDSYRTFNRAFYQSFGMTPSDHKKKIAGN